MKNTDNILNSKENNNMRTSKNEVSSFFNYLYFLNMYVLKRKPTIIVPLGALILLLVFPIILMSLPNTDLVFKITAINIFVPINFSIAWSFMILFGCMVTLTIFKEGKMDGIETLVVSKPITRQTIILAKFLYLLLIGIVYWLWIFLIFISTLYMLRSQDIFVDYIDSNINNFMFGLTIGLILIFFIFALLSSFISIKLSVKNTLSMVLISFPLLTIVGTVFSNPILFKNRPTETLFKILTQDVGTEPIFDRNPIVNLSPNGMVLLNSDNKPFTPVQIERFQKAWNESSDAGILAAINSFLNPTSMISQAFNGEQSPEIKVSWKSNGEIQSFASQTIFDFNTSKPVNYNYLNNNVIKNDSSQKNYFLYKQNIDGSLDTTNAISVDIPTISKLLTEDKIVKEIDVILKAPYNERMFDKIPTNIVETGLALLYMRAYEISSNDYLKSEYGIDFENTKNLLNRILTLDFFSHSLDTPGPIIIDKSFIGGWTILFNNNNNDTAGVLEPFIYALPHTTAGIINLNIDGFRSPTWGVMLFWSSVLILLFILASVYYYNEDFV